MRHEAYIRTRKRRRQHDVRCYSSTARTENGLHDAGHYGRKNLQVSLHSSPIKHARCHQMFTKYPAPGMSSRMFRVYLCCGGGDDTITFPAPACSSPASIFHHVLFLATLRTWIADRGTPTILRSHPKPAFSACPSHILASFIIVAPPSHKPQYWRRPYHYCTRSWHKNAIP